MIALAPHQIQVGRRQHRHRDTRILHPTDERRKLSDLRSEATLPHLQELAIPSIEQLHKRVFKVPDVAGRALTKARILLEDAGFQRVVVLYRESYTFSRRRFAPVSFKR